MNNSSFKRLGIIVMLLTSAVAVVGMGFGLWSQILTVNGTVQTGTVIAEWSNRSGEAPFTDDDGVMDDIDWDNGEHISPNPAPQIYDAHGSSSSADPSSPGPLASRYDKDLGICTVAKEQDTQGRDTILNITANNGYPSYWCTTHAYAINTGSIPLKLQDIVLIGVNTGGTEDQSIREGEIWCVDTDLVEDALELIGPPGTPCPENDGD